MSWTVPVDGQLVAGSGFPGTVSIPPTLLVKPGGVWTGILYSIGITTNPLGEVISADYGKERELV